MKIGKQYFLHRLKAKNRAENWTIHAEIAKNRVSGGRVPYFFPHLATVADTAARCSTHLPIEWWSRQVLNRRLAEVIRFVLETAHVTFGALTSRVIARWRPRLRGKTPFYVLHPATILVFSVQEHTDAYQAAKQRYPLV